MPLQRKPFANVTLLIHLIAETRALNRGLPVSLKLPCVESQMRACDNCTTRKSASFQIWAKLEPLYDPLQAIIRFFRVLIPASPKVPLAGYVPPLRYSGARAGNRGYHVPNPADPLVAGSIRLAPAYPPVASLATCTHP